MSAIRWRWSERDFGFRFLQGIGKRQAEYYQAAEAGAYYIVPRSQCKLDKGRLAELDGLEPAPAAPRGVVCLWFDRNREMAGLVPALGAALAARGGPFSLLIYDAAKKHGQIWLKRQVRMQCQQNPKARVLIYLPFDEERLERPGPAGEPALELLEEYRVGGCVWRVAGRSPTLFAFLRELGVPLPDAPADQRRLTQGGAEAPLARYAAQFAERPAAFWRAALTPELVRERLLGDAEQDILDLAVEPVRVWSSLERRGLLSLFRERLGERYGLELPDEPEAAVQEIVATLGLVDAWSAYGRPVDFPFRDRLPPEAAREPALQLLGRWLRDVEARKAWDRRVALVESDIDLTAWAAGRVGRPRGFPHLLRARWERVLAELTAAADRVSATRVFFEQRGAEIREEAEAHQASAALGPPWALLRDLLALVESAAAATDEVSRTEGAGPLAALYVREAGRLDGGHIRVRRAADELGFPVVGAVADRAYAAYTRALEDAFFNAIRIQGKVEISGVTGVTEQLRSSLWQSRGRRAVVIVDAFRLDCGLALQDALLARSEGIAVEVEPLQAQIPTITPIGMTALLPLTPGDVELEVQGNNPTPRLRGKDATIAEHRRAFLTAMGADCRRIDDLEGLAKAPSDLGELLVVFGHEEVDHIGHGNGMTLIRHLDTEIRRLSRMVSSLLSWGYAEVHVVTDHGFILLDEDRLPEEVPLDRGACVVHKERFALVEEGAIVPVAHFAHPWSCTLRVAFPLGLAFFKAEKSFSHGGLTLHELVIPHLTARRKAAARRVGVEVAVEVPVLQNASVRVVLRARAAAGTLFKDAGRNLRLDVLRGDDSGPSVVERARLADLRVEPGDADKKISIFLKSTADLRKGDRLLLDVRDTETAEQIPTGGIPLTVGRDL